MERELTAEERILEAISNLPTQPESSEEEIRKAEEWIMDETAKEPGISRQKPEEIEAGVCKPFELPDECPA